MRISRLLSATALALLVFAAPRVHATSYTLNASAPATANWTDTSGNVWSPAGGYPGSSTGDTASATGGNTTTLTVDSVIPNSVDTLTWSCAACVIDIQPAGQLAVGVSGTVDNGSHVAVNGGAFVDNAPMPVGIVFEPGTNLQLNSGTI